MMHECCRLRERLVVRCTRHGTMCGSCCMLPCCALCTACRVVSHAVPQATLYAVRSTLRRHGKSIGSNRMWRTCASYSGPRMLHGPCICCARCDRHWAVRSAVQISRASSRRPHSRSARCTHVSARHIWASSHAKGDPIVPRGGASAFSKGERKRSAERSIDVFVCLFACP